MNNTDDLIGSAQAARMIPGRDGKPIDRATFNRWVKNGLITPALSLDGVRGARLFRRSDVLALAERKAGKAAA